MKKNMILLVALVLVSFAGSAQAQTLTPYSKFGTSEVGWKIPVFNVIDSVIVDGTVLIADTSSTTSVLGGSVKRIGVRPYAGTAITRPRIVGLAVGNIRKSSEGGVGQALVWGYHDNAKMAASGLSANTPIKVAVVHGSLTTVIDSLSGQAGIFIGYTSGSTAAVNRGKVFITRPLGFFFGSL